MVKKCIVIKTETVFSQFIACFIQSMNLTCVVCVEADIDSILAEIDTEKDTIIVFNSNSFCTNVEYFCDQVYNKNRKTKLICICNTLCSKIFGLRLHKCGVNSVIEKFEEDFDLTPVLKNAINGKRYYPDEIQEAIDNREHLLMKEYFKKLSPREIEIINNVYKGYNNKIIASRLNICETTVSTTLNRINRKLGAKSREESIRMLLDDGILEVCA